MNCAVLDTAAVLWILGLAEMSTYRTASTLEGFRPPRVLVSAARPQRVTGGGLEELTMLSSTRRAVVRCIRRHRWLDPQDIVQEASLAALEALSGWDATKGPLGARQAFCARAALSRMVARARSPVSSGHHAGDLRGTVGVELTDDLPAQSHGIEWQMDSARAALEVRAILDRHSPAARAVLLDEEKPRDVARSSGVPVASVYVDLARAKYALRRHFARKERPW